MSERLQREGEPGLWTRARAGTGADREELCRLAREVAARELSQRGLGGHDVEELAQETVASTLRYLADQPEPPRELRAFLKFRARGVLGDWRKRTRVRQTTNELPPLADPGGRPASPLERADLLAVLRSCLERLPEVQREVVLQRYRTAEASRAIAARLGINKSTVNVRTFRALRALRECLSARGFGPEDLP
jgi:RNA polymerase sigma factor (sigma-70 family)